MGPDIFDTSYRQIGWEKAPARVRPQLREGKVWTARARDFHLRFEHISQPLFRISYRIFQFFKKIRLIRQEKEPDLRLEAVLAGELPVIAENGLPMVLKGGHYHLTRFQQVEAHHQAGPPCHFFVTQVSEEWLQQTGIKELVKPTPIKPIPDAMRDTIRRVMDTELKPELHNFFYDHCVRELMLLHLTHEHPGISGSWEQDGAALILAADQLLAADLRFYTDIESLARSMGTNSTRLKKGFKKQFKMSVFERVTWHRMNRARYLLETTNRTMDDIAAEVGYSRRTSFTAAFKRVFGECPMRVRGNNQGSRK
jgi:AraC-like DNA-binding protein